MRKWYALYTKPRSEFQVEQALEARQIETYLPTVQVWRARRRRMEEEPLFTGYLFARVSFQEVGLSSVAWTPGLHHIVGAGADQPTSVPNAVIDYIKYRVAGIDLQKPATRLKTGDPVTIKEGPMKDLDAVFDQHLSGDDRAQILVKFMGRLTRYDVPLEWLTES